MANDQVFAAIDADGAGRRVGQAVLADDVPGLQDISSKIDHAQILVQQWAESVGGQKISGGGDEMTIMIPASAVDELDEFRKDYEFAVGLTISVGVGKSLSEAGKSLLVAKFRGKNQVVQYESGIEQEIEAAKQHVADGSASDEERKLGEAYLKPKEEMTPMAQSEHEDCQYCNETAGNEDLAHCQYCHEAEQAEGEAHCQYCAEADQEQTHEHVEGEPCAYCDEASQSDVADDSQDYAGADVNPPTIDKPTGEEPAPGLGVTGQDIPTNSNAILDAPPEDGTAAPAGDIFDEDQHSAAAMQATVSELEDGSEAAPVGDNMEDNTSRPETYSENTPEDMGLSEESSDEESPDLSEVLQGGLDSHADNIQREKVVQMVGQALEGFKASKQVLERAKEAAPQLYQSSIAMLKAMIEMAKMLGLGEDVEQQSPGSQEEIAVAGEESPQEGKPAHFGQPSEEPNEQGPAAPTDSGKPAHFSKPADKAPPEGEPGKKSVGQ